MPRDIAHEILLLPWRPAQHLPEQRRLHEILVRDRQLLRDGCAGPLLMFLAGFYRLVGHVAVGAGVVWVGAVVAIDGHDAVALVGVECA